MAVTRIGATDPYPTPSIHPVTPVEAPQQSGSATANDNFLSVMQQIVSLMEQLIRREPRQYNAFTRNTATPFRPSSSPVIPPRTGCARRPPVAIGCCTNPSRRQG